VVVPLTGTKVWVLALNDEPLHHLVALVSSMATAVEAMVVLAPEFDEAVPVIVPVQSAP
jgi:hypothetical protein